MFFFFQNIKPSRVRGIYGMCGSLTLNKTLDATQTNKVVLKRNLIYNFIGFIIWRKNSHAPQTHHHSAFNILSLTLKAHIIKLSSNTVICCFICAFGFFLLD
jgi:hypothetical protein